MPAFAGMTRLYLKLQRELRDRRVAALNGDSDMIINCAWLPRARVFCKSPLETRVNDYDLLRDYLKKQKLPELVLSFEQIEEILDAALPRAAHRASWWETERSPQEKMPQREACMEAGYIATRQADGKSVKFKKMPRDRRSQGKSGGPE
jgi:hypothetical protein